jgi:hypothetical protein
MSNPETLSTDAANAHAANVQRIGNLISWNQPLTETDKLTWRDHLLALWEASKAALEAAKTAEMDLRKRVVDFSFDPNKKAGTERVELANGYELKAVKKINYGFVKREDGQGVDKNKIDEALAKIEAEGPVGELIAQRLIKWDPSLSLTEYKQLSPIHKAVIDAVIVATDGAPSLEIVPPKGSK